MTKAEFDRKVMQLIQDSGLAGMGDISDIFNSVTSAIGSAANYVGNAISSGVNLIGSNAASLITPLATAGTTILTAKAQADIAKAQAPAMMAQQLAQQGINMNSPQAQQLLQQVAQNGVTYPNGGYAIPPVYGNSSSIPSWLLPVGFGGAALVAVLLLKKKR